MSKSTLARSRRYRLDDRDTETLDAGKTARAANTPISANPHERGTREHREWSRGWRSRATSQWLAN
jgi:hypothetical protein